MGPMDSFRGLGWVGMDWWCVFEFEFGGGGSCKRFGFSARVKEYKSRNRQESFEGFQKVYHLYNLAVLAQIGVLGAWIYLLRML